MGKHLKTDHCSFHGDELTLSSLSTSQISTEVDFKCIDRRKHKRYEIPLNVKILSPNGSYSNKASNISAGGVLLEKAIPHQVDGVCDVMITHPETKETITFTAKLVGDLFDPRRLMFTSQPPLALKTLEKWSLTLEETEFSITHHPT